MLGNIIYLMLVGGSLYSIVTVLNKTIIIDLKRDFNKNTYTMKTLLNGLHLLSSFFTIGAVINIGYAVYLKRNKILKKINKRY